RATKAGRVLEDGTTQLHQFDFNALGLPTVQIDPEGRKTLTSYTSDNRYVTEVRQQNGANQELLAKNEYFTSGAFVGTGLVWKSTDASGNVTEFAYNSKGQVTQITSLDGYTYFTYVATGNGAGHLQKVERQGLTVAEPKVTLTTIAYDTKG
ncbi:hypothetical protein, partial [Klebsiella pneumoniae]|uniref:hypothetical protein n=1 Tax=Klebsiella pneumoniae TaxID=573 RepID=UPI0021D210E6